MDSKFNLIESPWIPCVPGQGRILELGIRDTLLGARELRELGGESPLVTAALHRLLLAVIHRVYGPPGYDAWAQLWQAGCFDRRLLDTYLAAWRERFNLFDAVHPFYQMADGRVKRKSVISMMFDAASGANATLFDHHTHAEGQALDPAEAARVLLAMQTFGLAGLSGLKEQKFTDAPWARGVIFLVQGDNLFETLMLNLVRYPADQVMRQNRQDRPAWEWDDPFEPDRHLPAGYLDHLTWQNRRLLLFPTHNTGHVSVSEMTMAPGLRLDASVFDPMKHYYVRDPKRGLQFLRFREDRALWRDSAALFKLRKEGYQPPQAFDWLQELVGEGLLDWRQTRRILALGMANNQARVDFFRTERMPLPLAYLQNEALAAQLDQALRLAEDVRRQLWGAAHKMATFVLCPAADAEGAHLPDRKDVDALTQGWFIERRYWAQLEVPFMRLLQALPGAGDQALADWSEALRRAARDPFVHVAEGLAYDAHKLKAAVRGREQLELGLGKALKVSA